jgi:site-specific DNA-methyltransferase (cytosine-N4-specific)
MRESNVNMSLFGNDHDNEDPSLIKLPFHKYRYFPYEKELARREIERLSGDSDVREFADCFRISRLRNPEKLRALTYVAGVASSQLSFPTFQHEMEEAYRLVASTGRRQATRYSVHALHEYKGRFNPQLARFLLNYLAESKEARVLDPFCGSGTTIVESELNGLSATGIDTNPLAVFISKAKLRALGITADEIASVFDTLLKRVSKTLQPKSAVSAEAVNRIEYLNRWFPLETLTVIESLRSCILETSGRAAPVLLTLVSDLLREYSLQEPSDLRIRRRICPLPQQPFLDALESRVRNFLATLEAAQKITGILKIRSRALLTDVRHIANHKVLSAERFDLIITSPPYATALPYIDTQRLSLIWLGLCTVTQLRRLEAEAIGSRELNGQSEELSERLHLNSDNLPAVIYSFCRKLKKAVSQDDGFRRQAVPALIYRYFSDMKGTLASLKPVLRRRARVAMVIGTNHTNLSSLRFDIDTPRFVRLIGQDLGYSVSEIIALQTYQRYGLHQKNAIQEESLIILERS